MGRATRVYRTFYLSRPVKAHGIGVVGLYSFHRPFTHRLIESGSRPSIPLGLRSRSTAVISG